MRSRHGTEADLYPGRVRAGASESEIVILKQWPGIPDYAQERVLERFFSLARPGESRKSNGLGLSCVREVAALHQGRILLD
ncbi:ATP-binding protein [Thiorhodovibrio frisius]|uniref:ATP-binding protein n=1 Tax=Thiorhodovibrio frisius TaxID=631362 RepID=UPI0026F4010F|nr:ATP-binding protein [Thiorhodovibrio frisius]